MGHLAILAWPLNTVIAFPVAASQKRRPSTSCAKPTTISSAYRTIIIPHLTDLHARVHREAYRATPSRRTYIPKADARQRPLAVAALEDKIVQRATVAVLNCICEEEFLGFTYGFRP
jgi:retron-type reverse transcriptase